jgi:ACS family hexuronate transporter-like MFS transporter
VARLGYSPFFVCLSILDIVGAVVLWTLVRERRDQPTAGSLVPRRTSPLEHCARAA